MSRPMSTSLAAALALGCLCGGPAAAQTPGVPRGLADREGIFIDGTTFKIVTGRAPGDAARQVEELGAPPLGAATLVFRSGGRLYVVETPVLPASPMAAQQSGLAQSDEEKPDRIRIEYVPPQDPSHQKLYELVKERRALEMLR